MTEQVRTANELIAKDGNPPPPIGIFFLGFDPPQSNIHGRFPVKTPKFNLLGIVDNLNSEAQVCLPKYFLAKAGNHSISLNRPEHQREVKA